MSQSIVPKHQHGPSKEGHDQSLRDRSSHSGRGSKYPEGQAKRISVVAVFTAEDVEEANNSTHGDVAGSDTWPTEASLLENHQTGPPPPMVTG